MTYIALEFSSANWTSIQFGDTFVTAKVPTTEWTRHITIWCTLEVHEKKFIKFCLHDSFSSFLMFFISFLI